MKAEVEMVTLRLNKGTDDDKLIELINNQSSLTKNGFIKMALKAWVREHGTGNILDALLNNQKADELKKSANVDATKNENQTNSDYVENKSDEDVEESKKPDKPDKPDKPVREPEEQLPEGLRQPKATTNVNNEMLNRFKGNN